jgi:hypothetical protein
MGTDMIYIAVSKATLASGGIVEAFWHDRLGVICEKAVADKDLVVCGLPRMGICISADYVANVQGLTKQSVKKFLASRELEEGPMEAAKAIRNLDNNDWEPVA